MVAKLNMVCVKEKSVGTNIRNKVCRTPVQIELEKMKALETVRRMSTVGPSERYQSVKITTVY